MWCGRIGCNRFGLIWINNHSYLTNKFNRTDSELNGGCGGRIFWCQNIILNSAVVAAPMFIQQRPFFFFFSSLSIPNNMGLGLGASKARCFISLYCSSRRSRNFQTSPPQCAAAADKPVHDKNLVPHSDPPTLHDLDRLYNFLHLSSKLVVLTGAGISTESGIPDYRSPNGAYTSGFKPITHQEFVRSIRSRRRYWARSYAGWRRFTAAHPGPAHLSLASLEKVGRIHFMITQNVDRLHHRAGSNPLELHGTVYSVICLECGFSICRHSFQDQLKALNPKWAEAIESLHDGGAGSDKSFGMKQRPDGDIEIDEKFWEQDFCIPTCQKCNGVLKPDVVFFGDNVPKDRATKAMEAARNCDAFLVLGSSVMTMSAFRLVRAAHEAGAATGIVNVGVMTRADDFVSLKINARLGEIMPRVLHLGSLSIHALQ